MKNIFVLIATVTGIRKRTGPRENMKVMTIPKDRGTEGLTSFLNFCSEPDQGASTLYFQL